MSHKIHPSQHRRSVNDLSAPQRQRLRRFLDTYITNQNPVGEHRAAGNDPTFHIRGHGFLAWHTIFISKREVKSLGRELPQRVTTIGH